MKLLHKHLLAGVVALGLGASAMAMPPASGDMCNPDGAPQGRMRAERMDPAKRAEHMQAWMAKRHAALHDKLKLNDEQEIAWKAYIANATPPAMMQRMNRADMQKLSAPERMEKML
ncbi:MAG: Spy/CpxP family protein refolding chaperone, partial [Burkholderiaceae bacterium]|nr:Spy/CpxP family protein refolding chaperone [Burkholderiaceae bacterium]